MLVRIKLTKANMIAALVSGSVGVNQTLDKSAY